MIQIKDKHNCCGCSACVQVCPKQCISFDEDEKGFRYPLVKKELCVDCRLCEKVCPCLNLSEPRKPLKVYAAINPNVDVRMKSSSGGIFSMLAEAIINEDGVVFGARFDENWEVKHDYAETKEGLEAFRGSKYVQSRIGNTYKQVNEFLIKGRKVLFSGTSCQIAGLKLFLRKDYNNLLTVEVVCHGVPSPLVWRKYLKYITCSSTISNIEFRNKKFGWRKFSLQITTVRDGRSLETVHEVYDRNIYMSYFLRNFDLRPSCYNCPSKCGKCMSDISLADFWGVENCLQECDDNYGVSLMLANTKNATSIIRVLNIDIKECIYEQGLAGNPSIEHSVRFQKQFDYFWNYFPFFGFKYRHLLLTILKVQSKINKFVKINRIK